MLNFKSGLAHRAAVYNLISLFSIVTSEPHRQATRERRPAHDERLVELHLTDLGEQILHEQTGLDESRLQKVLERIPEADRAAIEAGFALLLRHLEAA